MFISDWVGVGFYLAVLCLLAPILGRYIAKLFDREHEGVIEVFIYRFLRLEVPEQSADQYLKDLLLCNLAGFLVFFLLVLIPSGVTSPFQWHLAFNTAISFVTNTNWQAYSGEASLAPAAQMLGPTVQNFLSAGTGLCVLMALTRGLRNKNLKTVGNFWKDLTRGVVYLLLPLSFVLSLALVSQGVVQSFNGDVSLKTVEGQEQIIPIGPVASQVAIKQLGTNGGGYYGVNSAHPLENPTPLSNFLQVLAILLLPCSLVFAFGKMLGRERHAQVLFLVMFGIWLAGLGLSLYSEYSSNPGLVSAGATKATRAVGSGFWEGKEWRFSRAEAVLWSTATTAASNGSVNAMISSYAPLSGMVAMLNIMLGEIIFGGLGSGLYGMIIFVLITVFLSGLMVGRTPEYLQKKITAHDMKWVLMALIAPSCTILIGTALSLATETGLASKFSQGPHGLSEILYAWSSAAGNNGSAFGGLNANTVFYNLLLGIAMVIGRFGVIIPCLYLADSFSHKKILAANAGQMSTDNSIFGLLLTAIIIIIGALTFFPALLLGPIMEHILMLEKVLF